MNTIFKISVTKFKHCKFQLNQENQINILSVSFKTFIVTYGNFFMSLIPRLFPGDEVKCRIFQIYSNVCNSDSKVFCHAKQVQVKGQGIKFKVQTATYWKWNLLYTSLVQQTEDVDLTC